jgi:hypothetical protein
MIGSNNDRSSFKAWSPETSKAIRVYTHHDDLWSFAQLAISVPDQHKGFTSDRMHSQQTNVYKSVRAPDWHPQPSYFCTRITAYKKLRGSRSTFHTSCISFTTRFAAYKKQGLHRYVLQIYCFIDQFFQKFLQLSMYHHRWFDSTLNLVSASPSIHRNTTE